MVHGTGGGEEGRGAPSGGARLRAAWKASRYNFWARLDDGRSLLLNGVSGALFALSPAERDEAVALLSGPAEPGTESCTASPIARALRAGGFLRDVATSEVDLLRVRRRRVRATRRRAEWTVSPTYECNFRCPYCYVRFREGRMSRETEGRVLRFLEREAEGLAEASLTWFGGEPLLCAGTVCRVSERLRTELERRGVRLRLLLATNGYLLDSDMARRLLDAGVRQFHVTIDGPAPAHDRMRCRADGGKTFERVRGNVIDIVRAFPDAEMTLRTNIDESNVHLVEEFLLGLPEESRARMKLNLTPVRGEGRMPSRGLYRQIGRLRIHALGMGFREYGVSGKPSPDDFCVAERASTFHVGPRGELFKCSPFDKPEAVVGTILEEGSSGLLPANQRWAAAPEEHPECEECPYLCFCAGGCRVERMRGTFDASCRDRFADVESLVVYRYLAARTEAATRDDDREVRE